MRSMMGIGLALVHMGQSNTGGISLLGLIMQKCNPQFQVGAWISGLNIAVVLASAMVYRNIESLLYAVVTVYISGMFMDHMLENADAKNLMIVIADLPISTSGISGQEDRRDRIKRRRRLFQ